MTEITFSFFANHFFVLWLKPFPLVGLVSWLSLIGNVVPFFELSSSGVPTDFLAKRKCVLQTFALSYTKYLPVPPKRNNMAAIVKSPNDPRDYRYKSASFHSFVPLFSFISWSNLWFKISRMVKFTSRGSLQRKYRCINSVFQNDYLPAGFRSYVFFSEKLNLNVIL